MSEQDPEESQEGQLERPQESPPEESQEGGNSIGGSNVGGDVTVGEGGTFVGRDQYVGLNVQELVAALQRAYPAGDTRPQLLGQLLDEFRAYHTRLHEWKNMPNNSTRSLMAS